VATKTRKTASSGNTALPGQYFRYPNVGARSKFVPDANNQSVVTTLSQGTQINAATTKLDNLDIVKALLLTIAYDVTWTAGGGKTLTQSPFFPWNGLQQIACQFESAFNTFRLPGILAAVMQTYRPALAQVQGVGQLAQMGANLQQGYTPTSKWTQSSQLTQPSVSDASTAIPMQIEIPVSMGFDLYWEIDNLGRPMGPPIPRAIVSPQYMAANTRTVTPKVTYAPLLGSVNCLTAPVGIASTDATSTASGTASLEIFRDGWYPTGIPASPPVYGWQYSRDYLQNPTSGQAKINVPLDQDVAGQGQILSIVGFTWDPAANGGYGQCAPISAYQELDLNYSSKLPIYQDNPQSMQYRWLQKHGTILPEGFFGWDLALTEDGKFTNEEALNTLITAGVQAQLTFNSGSVPSSTSTTYIGLEMLKAVSS
jgi:hypothetical protein